MKKQLAIFLMVLAAGLPGCQKKVNLTPAESNFEQIKVGDKELPAFTKEKSLVVLDFNVNKKNELVFQICCANTQGQPVTISQSDVSIIGVSLFMQEPMRLLSFEKSDGLNNPNVQAMDQVLAARGVKIPEGRAYVEVKAKYKEYSRFVLNIQVGDEIHLINILSDDTK